MIQQFVSQLFIDADIKLDTEFKKGQGKLCPFPSFSNFFPFQALSLPKVEQYCSIQIHFKTSPFLEGSRGVKDNRHIPECQKLHLQAFYFHLDSFHVLNPLFSRGFLFETSPKALAFRHQLQPLNTKLRIRTTQFSEVTGLEEMQNLTRRSLSFNFHQGIL